MRHLWAILLVLACMSTVGVGLLVASARFRYVHPRAPQVEFEVTRSGDVKLASPDGFDVLAGAGLPRVELADQAWDFGTMNPYTIGEHTFEIRNTGIGNLWLKNEGTTCKCTVASLPSEVVRPGETAAVTLQWNTGDTPSYSHGATIGTNDPEQPVLNLQVHGKVLRVCQSEPAELHLPEIAPRSGASASLLVYSSLWKQFEIVEGHASLPQLTWRTEPATPDELSAVNATFGCRVIVDVAEDLPTGSFLGNLALVIRNPEQPDERVTLDIPVGGQKLGRFALFGTGLNEQGELELGIVGRGEGQSRRLVLRLRETTLPRGDDFTIVTKPAWLRAQVTDRPNSAESAAAGLYNVTIEVPEDAPPSSFLGAEPAVVTLYYSGEDGPAAPIEVQIRFAVVAPR